MTIKLAELKVKKSADYKDKIVAILEREGFTIVEEIVTTGETYYTIAIDKAKYLAIKENKNADSN